MSDIKQISFKSVGIRRGEEASTTSSQNTPIGIKMPMKMGNSSDGIYSMTYNLKDTIRQNMKNLLLTNWGERIGLYKFGANLQPITMELGSEEFDIELVHRIREAVSRWMPFVVLEDLQIFPVKRTKGDNLALIKARVYYNVPIARIERDAVEISFFIAA